MDKYPYPWRVPSGFTCLFWLLAIIIILLIALGFHSVGAKEPEQARETRFDNSGYYVLLDNPTPDMEKSWGYVTLRNISNQARITLEMDVHSFVPREFVIWKSSSLENYPCASYIPEDAWVGCNVRACGPEGGIPVERLIGPTLVGSCQRIYLPITRQR